MDYNEINKKNADYYEFDSQSRQLSEEMDELGKALNKFWRKILCRGRIPLEERPYRSQEETNVIEEIADVEVVLEQIVYLLDIDRNDIEARKKYKILRTQGEIEKEKVNERNTV